MQQRIIGSLLLTLVATVAVLLDAPSPATANTPTAPARSTENRPEVVAGSMHDFMEYVFQPTQERLRNSLAAEPASAGDWKAVRSDALFVAESCNLLFARSPAGNVADWKEHTAATRLHGASLYEAACGQDFTAAAAAYTSLVESCNSCHQQFAGGQHLLTQREDHPRAAASR